jgi:hypothetical protein
MGKLLCFAALAYAAAGQNSTRPELTARELFYNGTGAEAPKAQSQKQPPKQTVAKRSTPSAVPKGDAPAQPPQPSQPSQSMAPVINVSDTIPVRTSAPAPASGVALGLKYTILKLAGNTMQPAAPSSVFHTGDKIQFSVETNGPGYLYIVGQGSSGSWTPMFPAPEIENGNNRVEGFRTYTFPTGYRYVFDQQPGDEKVFIIFSRDQKPDFEQLVYSLQSKTTSPVDQPRAPQPQQQLLRASIDDMTVGRLHQTYARDLVIERVGDDAPADNGEKAVYVVNATGSSDSSVVADLKLVHR